MLCVDFWELALVCVHIIGYRGELSFLQPVHFCICWRDSAVLTGYLFRQWPACVHVPNWKNKCPGSQRCL